MERTRSIKAVSRSDNGRMHSPAKNKEKSMFRYNDFGFAELFIYSTANDCNSTGTVAPLM